MGDLMEGAIAKALEALLGDMLGGTVTRQRADHVMRTLAQRVATDTRNEALLSLLSTDDMASQLGVSVRRVRALARARGAGWQVSRGTWVFVPEDVERMRPGPPGRPASTA